jgi:hypothetical protein
MGQAEISLYRFGDYLFEVTSKYKEVASKLVNGIKR